MTTTNETEDGRLYLVKFHYMDGAPVRAAMRQKELVSYLDGNITAQHYSNDGDEIDYIGLWDGDDNLREVTIRYDGVDGAHDMGSDYMDWGFTALATDNDEKLFSFSVVIDGRA